MKILFFETVKSKVIISLFETMRLSVSTSPRNLYNSLKSIQESSVFVDTGFKISDHADYTVCILCSFCVIGLIISLKETGASGDSQRCNNALMHTYTQ